MTSSLTTTGMIPLKDIRMCTIIIIYYIIDSDNITPSGKYYNSYPVPDAITL